MERHDAELAHPIEPPSRGGPGIAVLALLGASAATCALRHFLRRPAFNLHGRVVIISGGVRGLGYRLADECGRRGARLVIFSRTPEEVERAETALRAEGLTVLGLRCDVRDPADVNALVSDVMEKYGSVDVLVNNAGVIQATPFEHAERSDFVESLETHFWGPLNLTRAALPHLRQARGRIVNISSIGGRIGVPHLAPYCVGKFALVGLSEALRAELAKDDVLVTTATPGLMRTGSHVRARFRGQHEREAKWFGLGVATPLTSQQAGRAARQIVDACVAGRAHVTPGVQARVAEIVNVVAPELTAAISAAVASYVLPGRSTAPEGDRARPAHEVGFGWVSPLLPWEAARRNQEMPI